MAIPGDALVRGENHLGLRYAWARAPRDVIPGAAERRPLAVAWDWLDVRDGRQHGAAGAEVVTGTIGGPPRSASFAPGHELAIPLPSGGGAPIRISLRAVGRAGAGAQAGLRLAQPVLDVADEVPAPEPARVAAPRPNVIVYLVDTLRADHLGSYGYPRTTSPHLDAFAREASVFRNAFAQSSWTKPAVVSLFTGLLPQVHRVIPRTAAIPEALPLLPALLHDQGYATLGVVTNGNVSRAFGFARGFDAYEHLREGTGPEIHQLSDRANQVAFKLLAQRPDDRPFFLYVHTADPHWPYTPREPFRTRLAGDLSDPEAGHASLRSPSAPIASLRRDVSQLYDGEIAFNDNSFGLFLEKMHELDLYTGSLIIFLSDHGEGFYERGSFRHGTTLFAEEVQIPLVIRFPGGAGAGRVVETAARQIDVLPTILDCVGAPIPDGLPGHSLRPAALRDGPGPEPGPTLAYLDRGGRVVEAAIDGGHKLIRFRVEGRGAPSLGLFDLAADPGETLGYLDE